MHSLVFRPLKGKPVTRMWLPQCFRFPKMQLVAAVATITFLPAAVKDHISTILCLLALNPRTEWPALLTLRWELLSPGLNVLVAPNILSANDSSSWFVCKMNYGSVAGDERSIVQKLEQELQNVKAFNNDSLSHVNKDWRKDGRNKSISSECKYVIKAVT